MIRPFIVGIAGGTASGKTSIAARAADALGATLLTHDRYYRDAHAHTNFDHPDALDTDRLVSDLDRLLAGDVAHVPAYDFARHARRREPEPVAPSPVVLVEGILVLVSDALRARYDLSVFVHAPADVRLVRRIRRDIAERGRDLEGVLRQYLATVRPMHEQYVEPSARHAALVLDGEGDIGVEVGRLVATVSARLAG